MENKNSQIENSNILQLENEIKRLHEIEEKYRSLFENAVEGIYQCMEDGKFIIVNPSLAKLLKYNSTDDLFNSVNNIDQLYAEPCHSEAVKKALFENDFVKASEVLFKCKYGEKIWVNQNIRKIFDKDNKFLYFEGCIIDITERKLAEEKIEEELRKAKSELEKRVEERTFELTKLNESLRNEIAERSRAEFELIRAKEEAEGADKIKTEFLAQVSHEIRTPINVILNYSSLIRFELEQLSREDLTQLFNSVERASSRLMRTIDLIVNMAQIQTQSFKPSFKQIDIIKILNQLINEYSHIAKTIGLDLLLKREALDTIILADEYTVTQVFLNLIDNAIKYTRQGYIEVSVYSKKDDFLYIDVKDTGIGIAPDFIPKLFSPFVQEETGYTRRYEGNGLGLAIVKKYVELNNGSISVSSEKGKGSIFTVCFKKSSLV